MPLNKTTQAQIDYWRKQGKPTAGKYSGWHEEGDKILVKTADGDKQLVAIEDAEALLTKLYADPQTGMNSLDAFYQYVSSNYAGIPRQFVSDVLNRIPAYSRFKPAIHVNATTKPIIASRSNQRFQMDLIDMSKLASYNSNYKWILTVIDVFSKKAYAIPLKNKTAEHVWDGIKPLLDQLTAKNKKPSIIQSDNGGEFKGAVTQGLEGMDIKQIFSSSYTPQSQGGVERFNKTIKTFLARHFAMNETKRWYDVLPDLMKNYNENRKHNTTGIEPEKLDNEPSEQQTAKAKAGIKKQAEKSLSFATSFKNDIRVGDHVRVALETTKDMLNKLRKKGYNPNWSSEIYEVIKIKEPSDDAKTGEKRNTPIKYKLKDEAGWFYRLRLMKTAAPDKQIGKDSAANDDPELNRADNVEQTDDIIPDETNSGKKVAEEKEEVKEEPKDKEVLHEEVKESAKEKPKKKDELRRSSRANKGKTTHFDDYVRP